MAAAGLTPSDLEQLRAALDGGRKPKVVFTAAAGQIAGQAGQVIELTDPASSDEWIVVRFGRDELPFSPSDLALPVRGTAKATAAALPARATNGRRTTRAAAPEPDPAPAPEFVLDRPPAPREGKTMAIPSPAPPPTTTANGNGNGAKPP